AAPLEARQLLDRLGECGGGHVFGLLLVLGQGVRVGEDLVGVALVQRRERRPVALRGQDLLPFRLELRGAAMHGQRRPAPEAFIQQKRSRTVRLRSPITANRACGPRRRTPPARGRASRTRAYA